MIKIKKGDKKIIVSEDTREILETNEMNIELESVTKIKKGDKIIPMLQHENKLSMLVDKPLRVKGVKGNKLTLEVYEPLKEDPVKRKELAAQIISKIETDLKEQIAAAVEKALEEKSIDELKETLNITISGEKAKVERRRGCMFVKIGDKSFKV